MPVVGRTDTEVLYHQRQTKIGFGRGILFLKFL